MKHLNKEERGLKFLLKDSYLKTIENSVGSRIFQNLYFKQGTKKIDVLQNGNLSCAVFVSSILRNFYLIKDCHTTVIGTVRDLERSGWRKVSKPKIGGVIVWGENNGPAGLHKHIGFYIGRNLVISNSSKNKVPKKHHWTFNGKRKVEMILWNNKLETSRRQ